MRVETVHASCLRLGLWLGLGVLGRSLPSAALAPCTDGIVFGNLTAFYQAVLGDDDHDGVLDLGETPSAYYAALPQAMKDMVDCGADPARTVPDIVLYRQRPENLGGLVRDLDGRVIARVYDHLDPLTKRFHVAVVLSGCYTDNVFGNASVNAGDQAYLSSVFWPFDHSHASNQDDDGLVGGFRCRNAAGAASYDYAPAGIELDLISLDAGSASPDEPEAATWVTNLVQPSAPTFPAAMAFAHATSAWWNLEMRTALMDPEVAAAMRPSGVQYWDLEDNSPLGGGDERPTEGDWKSPFADPASLFRQLGWGTTWFSDRYLWEWQHVYELSFASDACAGSPDDWWVAMTSDTHASPTKAHHEICGVDANQGSLTVIKDSIPDDPWDKYDFLVSGPTPLGFTLQDPGSNECPGDPLCANAESTGAWTHPDRVTSTHLIASPSLGEATYQVRELDPAPGSTVGWECKNAAVPLASPCDPENDAFDFAACPAVAAGCAPAGSDWADGHLSCQQGDAGFATCAPGGVAAQTGVFELCAGARVLCRFINQSDEDTENRCLETENAIGDLRVLGDVEPAPVAFATAAVPMSAADGPESTFLASFVPIADQSRWPGILQHFIQPLPVVEDEDGHLVPDPSRVCTGAGDTSCLAWDAAVEILDQAPDPSRVATDRQIGTGVSQRRVTYSKAAAGMAVPRALRAFDYSSSDARSDEHDLWQGMGIAYVAGDTASEAAARSTASSVIRRTLEQRTAVVTPRGAGESRSITFVAGDVFHGDPVLLGGPSNFFYLANDLEGNGRPCSDQVRPNRGYRCFFEKERRRRKVLLAPSNDGQLHAFDAGFFRGSVRNQRLVGGFDAGTGKELFAHIPRPMLLHTRNMVTLEHAPGIDGQITVDDVFIDPAHLGTPAADEREWRTVAIGTYREGARGIFALDLSHPDPVQARSVSSFAGRSDVEYVPVAASSAVPACSALARSLPSACGGTYPAMLWEFDDPDLGSSWSKANTGRVLVRVDGLSDPVVEFVAIFGGGLDSADPSKGRHLYMVDIETGRTLWKRAVTGSVPSEPAAVDTDRDGILDTVYVGTSAGLLYKVDLSLPGDVDTSGLVADPSQWAPFPIFDTEGRPIFFRPTVVFEPSSGRYAIAFGTGDRSDLWSKSTPGQEGRFYLILDPGLVRGMAPIESGPLTESDFEQISPGSSASSGNFLIAPPGGNQAGWVLRLGDGERVVSDALAVSGLLAFTTFAPDRPDLCSFAGGGQIYTLLASNANAVGGDESARAIAIEGFAGRPLVTSRGFVRSDATGPAVDPFEAARIRGIRDRLKDLFPAGCRFGSYSLNVSAGLSGQEVVPLAQIPVCVARNNWTEHF